MAKSIEDIIGEHINAKSATTDILALQKAQADATAGAAALARAMNDPNFYAAMKDYERLKAHNEGVIAQQQAMIRNERALHSETAKRLTMEQRFGRVGAMAVRGGSSLGLSIAAGARQGFAGTVEQNRLHNEMQMINRELAGAFVPAIRAATDGLRVLRRVLQALGPNGQNALMIGGGLASAYGAHRAYSLGSQIVANATGAAVAGRAAGGGAGTAAGAAAAGAAGGAVAKGSMLTRFGIPGAILAGGSYLGNSRVSSGVGELRAMEQQQKAGQLSSWGFAKGVTRATVKLGGVIPGLGGLSNSVSPFLEDRKGIDGKSFERKKDQVNLAQSGFEGIGSAYERVSNEAAMVGANTTALEQNTTALGELKNWIAKQLGNII